MVKQQDIIGELEKQVKSNRSWAVRCLSRGDMRQAANAMKAALTHEAELAGERLKLFTMRTEIPVAG